MNRLSLRDGHDFCYRDQGQGRPVVFLHGWGMSGEYFGGQVEALQDRYRCIAPDFRGHGRSARLPREGDPLDALAADTAELLERLSLTDVALVGWSMGAMVAWRLLEGSAAVRASSLVVIDMVPRILNDADWPHGVRVGSDASVFDEVIRRMQDDWSAFTRIFVPRIVAADAIETRSELLGRMRVTAAQNDPGAMGRLWRSIATQDFRVTVKALDLPCLVAYGGKSQLYGEAAMQWLVDAMPNAYGVCFEQSGHAPHLEETQRFNQELHTFLADPAREAGTRRTAKNR